MLTMAEIKPTIEMVDSFRTNRKLSDEYHWTTVFQILFKSSNRSLNSSSTLLSSLSLKLKWFWQYSSNKKSFDKLSSISSHFSNFKYKLQLLNTVKAQIIYFKCKTPKRTKCDLCLLCAQFEQKIYLIKITTL